jgi:hypothetical protein
MRHRADEPARDEIVCEHYDGYAVSCALYGLCGRWRECEDYIRPCANQLGRYRVQSRLAQSTVIDLKISALDEATGGEFLQKSAPTGIG